MKQTHQAAIVGGIIVICFIWGAVDIVHAIARALVTFVNWTRGR